MIKIGVSLVDVSSGKELQKWDSMPSVITHGGEDRTGAVIGAEFSGGCLLVERVCDAAPFGNPPVISEDAKFDGEKVIVSRVYGEPDLAPIKSLIIGGIKSEAGALILAYCPQYKQANLTAQAAELALTYPGLRGDELPEPYKTAWAAGDAIWSHIKAIRAHSNALEAEVNAMESASAISAWRSHDWPQA